MTSSDSHRLRYRTYLLRVWEERGEGTSGIIYRFSLENSRTHERANFADLDQLIAFLPTLIQAPDGDAGSLPTPPDQPE